MTTAMTSSLPQAARDVFDRYITTEYATIDARQQPIIWPVTPYYEQGAATIDVTTGIGYPKKADDAKRNPRVALLFSDPTGSGVERGPHVLVQGTAEVDEADLAANRERYRREAVVKLPATKDMLPPKWLEGLFEWYFDRIYVKTRPERVFVWPSGDSGRRRRSTTRTWRRCAPATARRAPSRSSPPRAARPRGTPGSRSWAPP